MDRPDGGWWRGYRELGPSKRVSGWFPATHVTVNAMQQAPMVQGQSIYETPTEGVYRPTRTPSPTNPAPMLRQRKASVTALMQDKRSIINAEIEKELRVRMGAENLLTVRDCCRQLCINALPWCCASFERLELLSPLIMLVTTGLSEHEQETAQEAR